MQSTSQARRAVIAVSTALIVSACGLAKKTTDHRGGTASDPAPQAPPFSLVDSQMCGTHPPAHLPDDPTASPPIDLAALEAQLKTTGVDGWIHGSVAAYGEFVFTYRDPTNFFRFAELSMVPASDAVKAQLAAYRRNDQVHVVGAYLPIPSPQKHIFVVSTAMIKKFANPQEQPYQHQTKLPADLAGKTTIYGVVHAQAMAGGVLALEYGDAVLPVFVNTKHRSLVGTLYRGDIVSVQFKVQTLPEQPTHLETDGDVDDAVQVVDHLVWCNQQPATLTGDLVLFPKSPEITMDIYAMRVTDRNGMQRNFTLTSDLDTDADMSIFLAIQAKAATVWAANLATSVQGRNQLVNPKIRVTAAGLINEVSQSQANPQVYLDGPDQISLATQP